MAAKKQATAASASDTTGLILDDRFRIFPDSPAAPLGGHACVQATDNRGIAGEVVALRSSPGSPPRSKLAGFVATHHPAMLDTFAHGVAGPAHWIIAAAPSGPSLASLASPWSGNALLTHVLRPLAHVLDKLQTDGLTHRAIRPDNLFLSQGGKAVVLGPGSLAPAAMHQPCVFEPAYSSVCAPAARGDGSIADDVYSLGVILLGLWAGAMPLAGLEPREIIRLKLEHGSHAALTSQWRLPRGFDEILRAMLADDPLARPEPAILATLDGIHLKGNDKHGTQRAARSIAVKDQAAWNRRTLALLCAEQPEEAALLLRQGTIEQWLRRSAEDGGLSSTIEAMRREVSLGEAPASSPQAASGTETTAGAMPDLHLMRLIALLDPLAPLFWRRRWMWPEALGPMLAGALAQPAALPPAEASALIEHLLQRDVVERWQALRPGRFEPDAPRVPARLLRTAGQNTKQQLLLRITYATNPYLACASPKLAATPAMTPLQAVDAVEQLGGTPLLDPHLQAYLDANIDDSFADSSDAEVDPLLQELATLARCQILVGYGPMLRTAANLLPRLEPLFEDWPGLSRREQRRSLLRASAAAGNLEAMRRLVGNAQDREIDEDARDRAIQQIAEMRLTLDEQQRTMPHRLQVARHAARDTASAAGLVCVMAMLLFELLS